MDCLVRNISPDGAKLTFTNAAAVPDEFDLTLSEKHRCYHVRAIWRSPDTVGVEFLKQHVQPTPTSVDWARRLHACENENAQLRKRLADVNRSW